MDIYWNTFHFFLFLYKALQNLKKEAIDFMAGFTNFELAFTSIPELVSGKNILKSLS